MMAPRKKFSKEDIILAAFNIAKEEGIDAITIRKVAKTLGSSIAPIYVNFTNVEELIEEVVEYIKGIAQQLVLEQNSGNPFRDIGVGGIKFARNYSLLYRDLIMRDNPYMKHDEEREQFAIGQMRKDPLLKEFSDEELKKILLKMDTLHTGLAVKAANNLFPTHFNEEQMIELLDEVAEDVIRATLLKKQKGSP